MLLADIIVSDLLGGAILTAVIGMFTALWFWAKSGSASHFEDLREEKKDSKDEAERQTTALVNCTAALNASTAQHKATELMVLASNDQYEKFRKTLDGWDHA